MISELKLAEMLCTRLCHDLAGPIGAVSNGSEFLAESSDDIREQAIELIASSGRQAVAKLLFFRNLYGRINYHGEASLEELKKIADGFFVESRVKLDWPDLHTDAAGLSISRRKGRLLLNLIYIASEALLKGGEVSVRLFNDQDTLQFSVKATGPAIKAKEHLRDILDGKGGDELLDPKNAEVFLAQVLARDLGVTITDHQTEDTFQLEAERIGGVA